MAVESVSSDFTNKKKSKSQKASPEEGNVTPVSSTPMADKSSIINGKTCHQCRHRSSDFAAACQNKRNNKPCTITLCRKCLLNRYGEKVEEAVASGDWSCPKCRGICNCSVCMKKRGHQPTGQVTPKTTGFSSVSEMLLKGAVNCDKYVTDMASPKKQEVAPSSRKRGKENFVDGKVDVNIPSPVSKKVKGATNGSIDCNTSTKIVVLDHNANNGGVSPEEISLHGCDKKSKKMKCEGVDKMISGKNAKENLKEESDDNKKNVFLARRTSPRKLEVSNRKANQVVKLNVGVELEKNVNNRNALTQKNLGGSLENDKKNEGGNNADAKNVLKHQTVDFHAEVKLPLGSELTSVGGIDVCAEDVGSALQFLEFCAVFGKVLEVKKGQPENVLRDLLHGRTARRGKFSLTVQFHIHLLSIIQTEQGEGFTELSPSYGKRSWYHALKKCLPESQSVLKAQELDSLETVADYETLDTSKKLRILNLLCDVVLQTDKVRNWIDNQNTKLTDKFKEAKQKVLAAKEKEKSLKQKLKDDIANAVIAKNGANLTISEHDAIVSQIKSETAQAHADVLDLEAMVSKSKQTCDAVRTEPLFIGGDGDVYWKLNCCGKSDILRQNVGKGDALTFGENWFTIDDEGKETIEKHISSLRGKSLKGSKGYSLLNLQRN